MSFAEFAKRYLPVKHPIPLIPVKGKKSTSKRRKTISGFSAGDQVRNWTMQNHAPSDLILTVTRVYGENVYAVWPEDADTGRYEERFLASQLLLVGSPEHDTVLARFNMAA